MRSPLSSVKPRVGRLLSTACVGLFSSGCGQLFEHDELRPSIATAIAILDGEGEPVTDVELTVVQLRTGRVVDLSDEPHRNTGVYVIFTSGHLDDGFRDRDELEVTGISSIGSFTEVYRLRIHCRRCEPPYDIEGPREIVLD